MLKILKIMMVIVGIFVIRQVFASGVNYNDSTVPPLVTVSPTISSPVLTGNTGIGTTSPQTSLALLGNLGVGTWTAAGGKLIINGGGNVGIASAWPGTKVDVNGTARATLFSGNGSALSSLSYSPGGGVNALQYNNGTTTSGSESIFSFNGTNVGIGTSNGGALLDVRGNVYISGNVGVGTTQVSTTALVLMNNSLGIGTWTTSAPMYIFKSSPIATLTDLNSNSGDYALARNSGDFSIAYSKQGDGLLRANNGRLLLSGYAGSPTSVIFGSSSTEYIRLNTSNGNLGIGTVDPASQLVVVGNGVGVGTGINSNYVTTTAPTGGMIIEGNVGINTYAPIDRFQVNSGTNSFIITSAGNVGISSANPGNLVDMQNGIRVVGVSGASWILNSNGWTGNSWSVTDNDPDQRISFSYGNTESMTITNSNPLNLGIGTSAPKNRVTVLGQVGIASSAGSVFQSNTAPQGGMIVEGNVGVGTITPQAQLVVLGNMGIGTWTASSGSLIIRNGNVGIGTPVPGAALEIAGIGASASTAAIIIRDSSKSIKNIINNSGNVGSGVYTPVSMLNLNTSNNNTIRFTNTSTGYAAGGFLGQSNSVGNTGDLDLINETPTGALFFGANNTTRMTITSAGNVGIATVLPLGKLSVAGFINTAGPVPTLSSCGTGPSIVGTDFAFTVTGGTGAGGCTITFAIAKNKTPGCIVSPEYATSTSSYTVSTTALTFTDAALSTNKVDVICVGYD